MQCTARRQRVDTSSAEARTRRMPPARTQPWSVLIGNDFLAHSLCVTHVDEAAGGDLGFLNNHRLEFGVHDVQFVHAALLEGQIRLQRRVTDLDGGFDAGASVGLPRTGVGALTELEVSLCLTANQVQRASWPVRARPQSERFRCDAGWRRSTSGQTAVTGDDQDCGAAVFVGAKLERLVKSAGAEYPSGSQPQSPRRSERSRKGQCLSDVTSLDARRSRSSPSP